MRTADIRFRRHAAHASVVGGSRRRNAIHNAIKKYGATAFKVETLLISNDLSYLRMVEKMAIFAYNTMKPDGYNLTCGGEKSQFWHPEVQSRMVESRAKTWAALTREEQVSRLAVQIRAMAASHKDPAVEIPRRMQIRKTMKTLCIGMGENNAMAKLTAECAVRIKDMLRCGERPAAIAKYFEVSRRLINFIKTGQRWAHA